MTSTRAAALVAVLALAQGCPPFGRKASPGELPPIDGGAGSSSLLVPYLTATGNYGYADRDGVMKIPPKFAGAELFYEGLAAVYVGGEWGFIHATGEYQIAPSYQAAHDFRGGKATVYRFDGPWLGPIMGLILKEGTLTTMVIDRTGAVLSKETQRQNNLPQPRGFDDLFGDRYPQPSPYAPSPWTTQPADAGYGKAGLFEVATGRAIVAPREGSGKLILDVDGSGPRAFASRGFDGPWTVYDLTGKVILAEATDVADYASEGCVVASGPNGWYGAFDLTGKRVVDFLSAATFAFRDGVARAYVVDAGTVFVDRKGRVYADLEYLAARHRAVGRAP